MMRINKILNNRTFRQCLQDVTTAERERIFCGHDIEHLLSVARIMQIYALENNIDIDKEIIYAAALLHDIGRAEAYSLHTDHAEESAKIARIILKETDFEDEEIDTIVSAVLHHNDSETSNKLCSLLRKADKQSRNCFLCSAYNECNWSENRKNRGLTL